MDVVSKRVGRDDPSKQKFCLMYVGNVKGCGSNVGGGGGDGAQQQRDRKCFNCGIAGFRTKDCRKPKKHEQG